jgi:hypothetical protein
MARAHRKRPPDHATEVLDRAFAQRDRTDDRRIWPAVDPDSCRADWIRMLADPPPRACVHQAAAVFEGRPDRWYVLAEDLRPLRRCAACVPADLRADLAAPDQDSELPIRTCACCGIVAPQAGIVMVRDDRGTVIAPLCAECHAEEFEPIPHLARLS